MSDTPLPTSARENIELVARVERQLHHRRSRAERLGDAIAAFFGSLRFIAAHAAAIAVWVGWNVRLVPGVEPFDPYPFPFLSLVVGVEFIFLTTFVLMNQSRQSRRQEHWSHLALQVALLTEREVTTNVRMLHALCRRLGVADPAADQEVVDLAQETQVAALVEEVEKAREQDAGAAAGTPGGDEPRPGG